MIEITRPIEVRTLLNPAFCGATILNCINGYNSVKQRSFPFALSYLILPIILHKETRESITISTRRIHDWIESNPQRIMGFHGRAIDLSPITREALTFLLASNCLKVDGNGGLMSCVAKIQGTPETGDEVSECLRKAVIFGKWLSQTDDPSTIFALLGVKP